MSIRLSAPKVITWVIAVIVGAVGILAHLVTIQALSGYAFWLVAAAFVLLAIAALIKGL
jgi:nicotinamide riboside transporter PnuC